MSSQIIVHGVPYDAPELNVTNFTVPGVARFHNQARAGEVNEFVFHETVTSSAKATVAVLLQRKLGVHFVIAPDGLVYQHGDVLDDMLWHASQHNPHSVGLELVNPYYPELVPHGSSWSTVINAPWADKKKYVVPTALQAEAAAGLLKWLVECGAPGVNIPWTWKGLANKKFAMGRTPDGDKVAPGIYAHMYFGHADGAWLALYAWLRWGAGLEAADAYAQAVTLATGAVGAVDLGPVYAANPSLAV